ncbi:anti-silencing ASF1-like protein [Cryptosporidium andersoni]|uniref:Anti-silencing ASF1-like protein n=1 Tax=Cryptosporidium andersoni TaxID=117008 RepID=A0A1J4MTV6_9CRYT|nr:anti-silencing ASF1-like protein [Cryptosporidium andersoni]
MALVNVTSVEVGKNPAGITDPFEFEISFECLQNLQEDLEWKITYISCAESRDMDQELDCIALGPITRGALKFVFHAPSPNFTHIPAEDIHGMAVVLILGSYRNEEFIRIGYYVHNVYIDPILEDNPPDIPIIKKLQRIILSESPRLTRFNISWDSNNQEEIKVDEIPDSQLSNNEDDDSQQFQVSNQTDNSILDNLNCKNELSSSNHSKYSDNIVNCKATYINEDTNNVHVSH